MTWILQRGTGRGLRVGSFAVRSILHFIALPDAHKGKPYNWYFDDKEKVAKMSFEKGGRYASKTGASVNTAKREFLGDDQVCLFVDEDAIYLSPYKDGQEYLEKFLKKIGVAFKV